MGRRNLAAMAALVAGLAAAGCTGNMGADGPSPSGDTAVLEVTNNNWSDMVVYLRTDNGTRQRLTTVTSMRTERIRLTRAVLPYTQTVRLEADPIGNNRVYVSDPILVTQGGTLVWRIEATPSLSFLSARR